MAIVQQIKDYQPTKATLLWSMAGAAALTMFVGFTWGGWVTGGTATTMAQKAADESTAKLAAVVCVERFVNAPDFATQLVALKETSRWQQRRFVEEGNWATLAGMDKAVDGAASLCAEQLAEMELPTPTDTTSNTGTAVQ